MKRLTTATIAGVVLVNLSLFVLAHSAGSYHGDPERGARIAAWGTSNGVASCSSCHGYDGVGNGANLVPRIAGQTASYLMQQLDKYAEGKRRNVYMTNFAQRLTPEDRADVAAYYASLRSSFPPPAKEFTAALLARGRQLATIGDDKLTVQSCDNCHGPKGTGEAPTIPALEGQYSNYIVYRLQQLAAAHNDADLMSPVASALSPEDMQAAGAYFEQLGIYGAQKLATSRSQ
jgi:cytochrome c553